ncbi:MAG: phosphatidylserine/phosphatidylglycerophosphate/cardiolipin synthase family protein, partial [Acidobacteriota bacterium]
LLLPAALGSASDLEDLLAREGRTRLLAGNHIETLLDGPESFERRLELIRSATHHLLISSFIWRRDDYGLRMLDAVAEQIRAVAADGGRLEVLVILDDGTPLASNDFWSSIRKRLRSIGAEVRYFNPPRWGLVPVYGARLHDKVVIADGRAAILGGRNYSDHYFVDSGHTVWLDGDILVKGPAVEDLQMHWLKSWSVLGRMRSLKRFLAPPEKTLRQIRTFWRTGIYPDGASPLERFADRSWFPNPDRPGNIEAAILYDNPLVWEQAPTVDVVIALVEGARKDIDFVTPFPNFPPRLMDAVRNAVDRGVRVRILTNSETRAVRGGIHWRALLPAILTLGEAGAEVWGWSAGDGAPKAAEALRLCNPAREPFSGLHAKLFQVDGRIAIVTASNFNVRSTWYNTEAGVLVADSSAADEIRSTIDRLTGITPLVLECHDGRPLTLRNPSLLFDSEQREKIKRELGDSAARIESYGPAF